MIYYSIISISSDISLLATIKIYFSHFSVMSGVNGMLPRPSLGNVAPSPTSSSRFNDSITTGELSESLNKKMTVGTAQ